MQQQMLRQLAAAMCQLVCLPVCLPCLAQLAAALPLELPATCIGWLGALMPCGSWGQGGRVAGCVSRAASGPTLQSGRMHVGMACAAQTWLDHAVATRSSWLMCPCRWLLSPCTAFVWWSVWSICEVS